jgi:hypothetical protein
MPTPSTHLTVHVVQPEYQGLLLLKPVLDANQGHELGAVVIGWATTSTDGTSNKPS